MSTAWREVRVFISSTFRDMHAERDHLVKAVFPRLRERLLGYRIHLVDIDLRWGVTKEQADNDEVLDLCLDEIDRCRPFFIGLLGERYGWVPTRYPVKGESKQGWVQAHTGKSVTELEILYGVLDNPKMRGHAFFYFRDPACLDAIPEPLRSDTYVETESVQIAALTALKQSIRDSDFPVTEPYAATWDGQRLAELDAFGEAVLAQLWSAIQTEFELPDAPPVFAHDALAEERDLHQRFAELRRRVYVPRPALHADLLRYLDVPSTKPLVLLGAAGSGKSATLAWLCDAVSTRYALLLPHFVGASAASTDIRRCLLRWCGELKALCGIEDEIPADYPELVKTFREWLEQVPADSSVLLVIDALNQLDETNNPHLLAWLPRELPAHVKIIVSALDDPERNQELVRNLTQRAERVVTVDAMTDSERFAVLHAVPSVSAKTLSTEQVRLFMDNSETRNPLYLLVALEELRGSARFETVDAQIANLPQGGDAVTTLFGQVIARLEADFDPTIVQTVLCALACARAGLPERDLEELAGGADIYPVLRQLRPYLQPRGDKVDFFHRQLFKAVQRRYLTDEVVVTTWHQRLADHLDGKGWTYRLTLEELVWQQLRAKDWSGVERTLTTLGYLEAKHQAGLVFELAGDYRAAWQALPQERLWQQSLRLLDQALRRHLQFLNRHHKDYTQALFQCLWNEAWWYDTPKAAKHYDPPEHGWGAGRAPWERDEPKLSTLLERWQTEKEAREPGFCWVRSHRPPTYPLGGAEMACLRGHEGSVSSVAWSPDGTHLALGSGDQTVRVWDAANGAEIACLRGHEYCVFSVAWSPDGTHLVSGSHDQTVRVWDAASGAEVACLRGHLKGVSSVAWSPDGTRLASGSADETVRVWDAANGVEVACLRVHANMVSSVAWSPDGARLVSGSMNGMVRVWDAASKTEVACLCGHERSVYSVAWSPDGTHLVSGSHDQTVRVWDAASGAEVACQRGHEGSVSSVAWSPDGTRLVSGSGDKTVRVWDAANGAEVACLRGHALSISSVACSPDGAWIVSGSDDQTVRVWDAASRAEVACLRGHTMDVRRVTWSPDGMRLVDESQGQTVRVWDAANGAEVACLPKHESRVSISSWDWSPDGTRFVTTSDDKTLRVRDVANGAEMACLCGHEDLVSHVAWSSDGTRLVSGSWDKTVRVWDVATGTEVACLRGHEDWVSSVAWSPDGTRLVSGSNDKSVRVWDVANGAEIACLRGHEYCVFSVAWSPDGTHLVSGSADETIRVWNAANGIEVACVRGHAKFFSSVAWSPDGMHLVTGSGEQTVQVWDVASGACLEVKAVNGNVAAIAAGAVAMPYRALRRGLETMIERSLDGQPVAVYAAVLNVLETHPNCRTWVGAHERFIEIISLEGNPEP